MTQAVFKKFILLGVLNAIGFVPSAARAQEIASGPGRDAPAGVMNSMLHQQGEWMGGLHLMSFSMSGNRSGTTEVTEDDIYAAGYQQAPRSMTMLMPGLDIMYGATDHVTLTATVPFVINSMDMDMMNSEPFTMHARGVGDVRAGAMLALWRGGRQDVFAYAGAQVPVGKTTVTDNMPNCTGCEVDYPMQPGSGTFDLTPGLTWVADGQDWSWGANWLSVFRTGTNTQAYRLGDRHDVSVWSVRHLTNELSASLRLAASHWGNIKGSDPDFDPTMSPTQNPATQAGKLMNIALGLAFKPAVGPLRQDRFSVEFSRPVVQSLDGPQLATSWGATLSWQIWMR